jgi:hypothetical protein
MKKGKEKDETNRKWTWKEALFAIFNIRQEPVDDRPIEEIIKDHESFFRLD